MKMCFMSFKDSITVQAEINCVLISVSASGDDLLAINAYVDLRLQDMKDEATVKCYRNRVDFFIVKPQKDWTPQELYLEIQKRLSL
jgi:hypothetical protein